VPSGPSSSSESATTAKEPAARIVGHRSTDDPEEPVQELRYQKTTAQIENDSGLDLDDDKDVVEKAVTGIASPETEHDPLAAETAAEFVQALKTFRISKGEKPYRDMERTCEHLNPELSTRGLEPVQHRSYAAFSGIGKNGRLPKIQLLRAYVVGAGGTLEDLDLWEQAWKRLATKL
jgi:hypothetical protein